MIDGISSGFGKLKTINRRMFLLSAAKVIIFSGIVTRLFSLQINENSDDKFANFVFLVFVFMYSN